MAVNKDIHIVTQGESRPISANIRDFEVFLSSDKQITWKRQEIEKEEVAKNPLRMLFTVEDKGVLFDWSRKMTQIYTFKKSEVGKYIKFYAYIENFDRFQQSTIFYVEDKCNTNVRIRGVERVDSDSAEVVIGEKIKLKVIEYNVPENKVSDPVKKDIKWMIKVGNDEDERLIINGVVITGNEIEFYAPEEWEDKDVLFMPYLNIHTPEISLSLNFKGYALDIQTLTPLHKGSTNDGTGNEQDGLIYNKSYEFETVFSSAVEEPKDENNIKWEYSYYNEDTGETIVKTATGKKIKIKVDDLNMLGKHIELLVYVGEKNIHNHIHNKKELWVHYRFRWIDRKLLLDDVKRKLKNKHTIDQGSSSLCGFAFIGYHFAKQYPADYESYINNIHRTGTATISRTSYTVTIDSEEHLVKLKTTDPKFPMTLADYMLLVTLRDHKNTLWDYDPDAPNSGTGIEGATGMTFPHTVEALMKDILGFKNIIDKTNLATSKWTSVQNSVKEMQTKLNEGYIIAWFINTNAIIYSKKDDFSIPNHWVGLESISLSGDIVSYRIYTWGSLKNGTVNIDNYKDGNYGYVAGKR